MGVLVYCLTHGHAGGVYEHGMWAAYVKQVLYASFSCFPRMKTAFFIFDLAETASVTAKVKSQLYSFAYTVSHMVWFWMLPTVPFVFFFPLCPFFFFFTFLDFIELRCFHIGPAICLLSASSKPGAQQIQRDSFGGFIRSYLPPRSRRMPEATSQHPAFAIIMLSVLGSKPVPRDCLSQSPLYALVPSVITQSCIWASKCKIQQSSHCKLILLHFTPKITPLSCYRYLWKCWTAQDANRCP